MKKSKKELLQGMSFTIDINKLSLNRRKFTTSEIGRGIGIEKNKKGKGSYTRKNVNLNDISYGCFCFYQKIKAAYNPIPTSSFTK